MSSAVVANEVDNEVALVIRFTSFISPFLTYFICAVAFVLFVLSQLFYLCGLINSCLICTGKDWSRAVCYVIFAFNGSTTYVCTCLGVMYKVPYDIDVLFSYGAACCFWAHPGVLRVVAVGSLCYGHTYILYGLFIQCCRFWAHFDVLRAVASNVP